MRRAGSIALVLILGFVFSSSCAKKRDVSIELLDACASQGKGFKDQAAYVQFAVYPDGCPSPDVLVAGDTSSARFTATVKSSANLPDVGDLPKSSFGFAVILRDTKCTVIGYGCTKADLSSISGIRIAACDWQDDSDPADPKCSCTPLKGGGCIPPQQCNSGKCSNTPVADAGGCSLIVEKAGKLPDPVAATARVTGPGIVATDDGFVLGYRDQDGATLRAVIAYLTDGGTLAPPAVFDLGGCANKEPTDGVGLAYEGGAGLMTTSLPDCGKGAGAVFIPFDSKGNEGQQAAGPRNGAFLELDVAPQGFIAPAANDNEYEFLYRVTTANPPVIERVVLQGPAFKTSVPIVHPFGEDDNPFGMVATTPQVRAFLAPVQSAGNTIVLVGNRSSDTISIPDGGTSQFTLPLANWAAITAWNTRVAAAVPAATGMTMTVGEFVNNSVKVDTTGVVGTGAVSGGALATLRSHLFVAQSKAGGITVHRLEDANGAIATKPADSVLSSGDPTGGWALLRCAE
jgi:hypothetical protein